MPKMRSAGSVSFNGNEFKPDKDGIVHVPVAAVDVLKAHGLQLVEGSMHDDPPMPAEVETVIIGLRNQLGQANSKIADLIAERDDLKSALATFRLRVRELEALSGPETGDLTNIDPAAPKFGGMDISQLVKFAEENGLEIDPAATPGSIIMKRSAVKKVWDALVAKRQAA